MIISTDTEKSFDKIQHPFMIKILKKLCINGMYFNNKGNHQQNEKTMRVARVGLLDSGCPIFNIILEVLAR